MNDKNKKTENKKAWLPGVIVFAAIMLFNALDGSDPAVLVSVVAGLLVVASIIITIFSVRRAALNRQASTGAPAKTVELHRPYPTPEKTLAKTRHSALRHADEAEEAIRCDHVRGKQKYIQQLDSYLKNGIIDKAEYKILRERYEKLDIPDDYH